MAEWIDLEYLSALELVQRKARINQSAVGGLTRSQYQEKLMRYSENDVEI